MVNSGSFDSTDGNRNGKTRCTQAGDAALGSQPSDSDDAACKSDCPKSADGDLPSDESKTEINSNMPPLKCEPFGNDGIGLEKIHPSENAEDKAKHVRKLLCLYCDRSFVSANLRQKHVERVHSVKHLRRVSARRQNQLSTTPCAHCDKLNTSEHTLSDLFQHLVREHPTKYFGCLSCEEKFATAVDLVDHNRLKHSTNQTSSSSSSSTFGTNLLTISQGDEGVAEGPIRDPNQKVTRSKLRCGGGGGEVGADDVSGFARRKKKKSKLKELRNKKISVKSSKIAIKRSKRLQQQAKEGDVQKKRREKKLPTANKLEVPSYSNNKQPEKSNKTAPVNPFPEFDHFYRVKKITDHSIDNLKISSLTFDDVFDKAFFNRIKCNIEENLLHHIDGKLFKNEESESRISNFEKVSTAAQEIQNANADNYGCEISLNAITPASSLSLNSQFGEDFESQIEYGSKPSKKRTQIKSDEVHYKYFTRRKYQASILQQKENRDLSKLDMWTQMVVKDRQERVLNKKKSAKEMQEYTTCQEYRSKIKREELNRILDRRGPFEDLKEEASKKAAFDKLNSSSDNNVSQEVFTHVREVLNDLLNRVFEAVADDEGPLEVSSKEIDHREIPAYLDLRRKTSSTQEEIDKSDRIALICSSQETENFELPTNTVRSKNELVELTGEWARSRMYICAACGGKFSNMRYLIEHKSIYHQNVWVQHYEFVGNQGELYRHLSIPGLGKVGIVEETVPCKQWKRSDARTCTKCGKQCNALGELHRHVLECGGDWTWMLARKKCKYRPFGAKTRRKLRGFEPRIHNKRKTEPSEKKKYKKPLDGPRQRPSDADTIQRMLANLPPKRSRRSLISLSDVVFKSRKPSNSTNTQKHPAAQVKCGKPLRKKQQADVSSHNPNQQRSGRTLRSFNKVLSSRILDLNSSLLVKRKMKVLRNHRLTRQRGRPPKNYVEELNDLAQKKRKSPKKDAPDLKEPKKDVAKATRMRLNIKNFFPIKKKGPRPAQKVSEIEKIPADPNDFNKNSTILDNFQHMNKNKRGGLKGFVRALSLRKRNFKEENAEKTNQTPPKTKKNNRSKANEKGDELLSKKRKLQRSFRNVINKVKKVKTENASAKKSKKENAPFLDETSVALAEPNQDLAPIVNPNLNDSKENPPIPETIFNLETSEEKSLQAKGELDFDVKPCLETTSDPSKTSPMAIDTSLKPKCAPLVSPGIKGKIRKPSRGLNDCIAMLTSKLQQKEDKTSSSSLESLFSTSSAASDKVPKTLVKPEISAVTDKECPLDLSKKSASTPNLLLSAADPELNKHEDRVPSPTWNSVDDIIQQVVHDSSLYIFNKPRMAIRTNVDDTIDFVVTSSLDWFETTRPKARNRTKTKRKKHCDDNLITNIIFGKDKLIIAPSSDPKNDFESPLIAKIKENEYRMAHLLTSSKTSTPKQQQLMEGPSIESQDAKLVTSEVEIERNETLKEKREKMMMNNEKPFAEEADLVLLENGAIEKPLKQASDSEDEIPLAVIAKFDDSVLLSAKEAAAPAAEANKPSNDNKDIVETLTTDSLKENIAETTNVKNELLNKGDNNNDNKLTRRRKKRRKLLIKHRKRLATKKNGLAKVRALTSAEEAPADAESKTPEIINCCYSQRTRRKSKSSKKIHKTDDDLFKNFSLVINKKTKRIPPTSIVDDSVCDDAGIDFFLKPPEIGKDVDVGPPLNDSVEEMDMEIEDIPINISIIERDDKRLVALPSYDVEKHSKSFIVNNCPPPSCQDIAANEALISSEELVQVSDELLIEKADSQETSLDAVELLITQGKPADFNEIKENMDIVQETGNPSEELANENNALEQGKSDLSLEADSNCSNGAHKPPIYAQPDNIRVEANEFDRPLDESTPKKRRGRPRKKKTSENDVSQETAAGAVNVTGARSKTQTIRKSPRSQSEPTKGESGDLLAGNSSSQGPDTSAVSSASVNVPFCSDEILFLPVKDNRQFPNVLLASSDNPGTNEDSDNAVSSEVGRETSPTRSDECAPGEDVNVSEPGNMEDSGFIDKLLEESPPSTKQNVKKPFSDDFSAQMCPEEVTKENGLPQAIDSEISETKPQEDNDLAAPGPVLANRQSKASIASKRGRKHKKTRKNDLGPPASSFNPATSSEGAPLNACNNSLLDGAPNSADDVVFKSRRPRKLIDYNEDNLEKRALEVNKSLATQNFKAKRAKKSKKRDANVVDSLEKNESFDNVQAAPVNEGNLDNVAYKASDFSEMPKLVVDIHHTDQIDHIVKTALVRSDSHELIATTYSRGREEGVSSPAAVDSEELLDEMEKLRCDESVPCNKEDNHGRDEESEPDNRIEDGMENPLKNDCPPLCRYDRRPRKNVNYNEEVLVDTVGATKKKRKSALNDEENHHQLNGNLVAISTLERSGAGEDFLGDMPEIVITKEEMAVKTPDLDDGDNEECVPNDADTDRDSVCEVIGNNNEDNGKISALNPDLLDDSLGLPSLNDVEKKHNKKRRTAKSKSGIITQPNLSDSGHPERQCQLAKINIKNLLLSSLAAPDSKYAEEDEEEIRLKHRKDSAEAFADNITFVHNNKSLLNESLTFTALKDVLNTFTNSCKPKSDCPIQPLSEIITSSEMDIAPVLDEIDKSLECDDIYDDDDETQKKTKNKSKAEERAAAKKPKKKPKDSPPDNGESPVNFASTARPSTEDDAEDGAEMLRRSRRGSRKIASYNENDLIDPLVDALESRRSRSSRQIKPEKPKLSSEELFDLLKKTSSCDNVPKSLEEPKDVDKIYEFTEESPDNTEEIKELFGKNKKRPRQQSGVTEAPDEFETNDFDHEKSNYCEICKKSFIRTENLVKHKTTLTHISKLSELEAKAAEEKAKLETNQISLTAILQHPERTHVDVQEEDSAPLHNNHSLKLVDIINDVLNKPVIGNSHHQDFLCGKTKSDVRRCKSLGERKSFESDNVVGPPNPYLPPPAPPALSKTSILENQINLLENIIGNNLDNITSNRRDESDNFIDEISSCSNVSNATAADLDNNSCGAAVAHVEINNYDADFLKPTQYEEISEDSTNARLHEDPKQRKTLNRDEELFLECCSLLKSRSEVSNSNVKQPPSTNVDEPNPPVDNNKLIQTAEEAHHEYSDNSRTPTPLGDTYDDDASNSNTISSNWHLKSEKPMDENRSFSFEEVKSKEAAGMPYGEMLTKGLRNQFENVAKPNDRSPNDVQNLLQRNLPTDDRKDDSDSSTASRKVATKGARKVYEALKVSIPTEDLDLEVLNSSPLNRKFDIKTDPASEQARSKPRSTRKSKPVKKAQVGSNLLFKVNKKKPSSQLGDSTSAEQQTDLYNFEETLDNTFIKPTLKESNSPTVPGVKRDDNNIVLCSDNESLGYADSIGADAKSVSSVSSVSAMSAKKPEVAPENITKKKYKIMGKIFRNAAKSKMDDIDEELRSIPEIPEIDNLELVENYVRSCQRVKSPFLPPPPPPPIDDLPKKPKMTEEEMNMLFDQLLGKAVTESKPEKPLLNKSAPKVKNADNKRKNNGRVKNRKRARGHSDSSDDEFNINRTAKKRSNKKNNQEDSGINLELELKECIGVASRKSQRTCTSGKQNILLEYWSSDEEAFEAMLESHKISTNDKKKKVVAPEEAAARPDEPSTKPKPAKKKKSPVKKSKPPNAKLLAEANDAAAASNRRKRAAVNPLYHWSSSSEDESQSLIEIRPIREEDDEDDRPVQHGWIVGDSPKKLVTMLALTKGKKTDIDCVKEQGKRRTSNTAS